MDLRLNIKNIIRILAVLMIAAFFLPAITISAEAFGVKLAESGSMFQIAFGFNVNGEKIGGAPVMVLTLLLPIILIGVSFLGRGLTAVKAGVSAGISLLDIILWIVCKVRFDQMLKEEIGASGFDLSPLVKSGVGFGFIMTILLCIAVIVLCILCLTGMLDMDRNLLGGDEGLAPVAVSRPASPSVGPVPPTPAPAPSVPVEPTPAPAGSPEGGWVCPECGASLKAVAKFCTKCGAKKPDKPAPVPTAPAASPDIPSGAPAGSWTCPGCGAVLKAEAKFCTKCGEKKPDPGTSAGGKTGPETSGIPGDIPGSFPGGIPGSVPGGIPVDTGFGAVNVPENDDGHTVQITPPSSLTDDGLPYYDEEKDKVEDVVIPSGNTSETSSLWGSEKKTDDVRRDEEVKERETVSSSSPIISTIPDPGTDKKPDDEMKVGEPSSPWKVAGDSDLDL